MWNIRNQRIHIGNAVCWMSAGSWDGKVLAVIKENKHQHKVQVKACTGEIFWLVYAENYGMSRGHSKFILTANKPSYQGWEVDWPELTNHAPQCALRGSHVIPSIRFYRP